MFDIVNTGVYVELLNQFLDWTSHYFYQLPGEWQFIVFLAIVIFAGIFIATIVCLSIYGILLLIWRGLVALAKSIWEAIMPKPKTQFKDNSTKTTKK